MKWTGPVDNPSTWLAEPAKSAVVKRKPDLSNLIAKARKLSMLYTRTEVARQMGVHKSLISKWLGKKAT